MHMVATNTFPAQKTKLRKSHAIRTVPIFTSNINVKFQMTDKTWQRTGLKAREGTG